VSWHPEVLSATQRRVLEVLGPVLDRRGFYLAGGTALALQLGHRRSIDFDWFSTERIGGPELLVASLRDEGIPLRIGQIAAGTVHGRIAGVRVTLLEYKYPLVGRRIAGPRGRFHMAGPRDIGAMKLVAIAQRGTKKDFVDLDALLRRRHTLRSFLDAYRKKFRTDDFVHVLYALSYFDDAGRERMPAMLDAVTWSEVRARIERQVLRLAP
jgi:hypothetical protein